MFFFFVGKSTDFRSFFMIFMPIFTSNFLIFSKKSKHFHYFLPSNTFLPGFFLCIFCFSQFWLLFFDDFSTVFSHFSRAPCFSDRELPNYTNVLRFTFFFLRFSDFVHVRIQGSEAFDQKHGILIIFLLRIFKKIFIFYLFYHRNILTNPNSK